MAAGLQDWRLSRPPCRKTGGKRPDKNKKTPPIGATGGA